MDLVNEPMSRQGLGRIYDVFLSFRGQDTGASFSSRLYSSLRDAGITVFRKDTELYQENGITNEFKRVIEGSEISVIIFSRDYASSKWCLEELSKIMELHRTKGQVVLPVFYDVDPSEVRRQTSSFGEEFQELIQRNSSNEDEVSRWRTTLFEAASIAGFTGLNSKNESQNIENIVEHVCNILDKQDLIVADHPVGVNSRVQELISMLQKHRSEDVIMAGIWGMGGLGKSTLARAFYNEIRHTFESTSFLSNIHDVWYKHNGTMVLQEQLLSDIFKTTKMTRNSIETGKLMLKERLRHKRALIVLNDVSHVDQLDALCISPKWFGRGSRIIITTRDRHLLRFFNVELIYRLKLLNLDESLELFSWHAFKQVNPKEGFIELSERIASSCQGLPLALKVIGSALSGRTVGEWESALEKLKRIPNNYIHVDLMLKVSFDWLSDELKEIFLNIAESFIGEDKDQVIQTLNARGFFADIGIQDLEKRSLITTDKNNKLYMHGLLKQMGREIIRRRSLQWLGERGYRYDVFLSFRGEDNRPTFTSHLYSALSNAGIVVFKDDELHRGNHISIELSQAIESTRISIVIFSQKYAGSRWCLEELSKIMELQKTEDLVVFPVFYDVDPSEVRRQTYSFGEAFERLIQRISPTQDQVLKWRTALHEAGGIAGFVVLGSK